LTIWADIDEPVLRWLAGPPDAKRPWRLELTLRPEPEPAEELEGAIDTRQFDDALIRLRDFGLVAGERREAIGYASWWQLRVTGQGLQVLGVWPDLERLTSAAGLSALLDGVADEAEGGDDKRALRRTAGLIGQLGDGIVMKTLEAAGDELGRELD
jgi:hypothetical protein